jgi:hypothetical protein
MHRSLYGLGGWLVGMSGATGPAWACAVCGFGQGERALAYFTVGWIMNAVPLVLIGGVAWYLWRLARSPLSGHTARQGAVPTGKTLHPRQSPLSIHGYSMYDSA